jgi:hypothetical protein
VIVEIPFHDEFAITINVGVPRRMITDPCDEDVAASTMFA